LTHITLQNSRPTSPSTDPIRQHHTPDLLHVAKLPAEAAAMTKETDRYAWASHYLQERVNVVIYDGVKVLESPCNAEQ
jgi:hypothetical protein